MRIRLLNCLGGALVKHGVSFLLNLVPGGEVLFDIAADTWKQYRRGDEADTARAELEELAQTPLPQLQEAIAQTVAEVAASQPAPVQEALATYLAQVPATIRRSLRRPSDPSGTTMPSGQMVRDAQDLVPFLPARLPRFKAGDRPLPGVDWELEELAGVGGFGEVWKARHPYLKSKPPVALKFCLDPSSSAALRNEAGVLDRVMQQGRHAGIVPLLHTYLSADPPCLEYEYVEGGDLAGLIQEMHARGRVKAVVANRLLVALAEIVSFAHKAEPPIVHGDLKPANVLVRRTSDGKVVLRVIDFGIGGIAAARAAQEVRQQTRCRSQLLTDAVRGAHTPMYASPEQMARRPGALADPRDDVHALGVIWFQVVTGDLTLTSVPTDWREQLTERGVSEDLVRLIGACLAPKAEKRPASAVALVEQIKAADAPMLELVEESAPGPAKAEPLAWTPMAYSAEISRTNPSCFLFLIDQSGSMRKPIGGSTKQKADVVADAINRFLQTLVLRCAKSEGVRDYFYVGVIGYGKQVAPGLGGRLSGRDLVPISDVAKFPLRVEERIKKVDDGAGGFAAQAVKFAVWFEPLAAGPTPMCQALDAAWRVLADFLLKVPACFPPVVINITDGVATDGDPEPHAIAIRKMASQAGNVLFFNLHVSSSSGEATLLADCEADLTNDYARQLFRMSSVLPAPVLATARRDGLRVTEATRGFCYNADLVSVVRFLDIGTRVDAKNLR